MLKKDDINESTHWRKSAKDDIIKYALNISNDPEKKERLKTQLCVICYYKEGGFAGQAFTNKKCVSCDKDQTYSSTYTDNMCMECAKKENACKHCNCDINLKNRR